MSGGSRHAPPRAAAMIEALRGLGYSTATALADIVDNSVAAGAATVTITFGWPETGSYISVLDDGRGMTSAQLDTAMRLGEINPLDERESSDLGRFGLGLKTASFSQCRRLTVASRKEDQSNCLRWDLDVIARSEGDGWYLLEGTADGSQALLAPLETVTTGTLVLWELLDRVVTPGFSKQDFLDLADRVEQHLGMVFHRYLASRRLRITINGRPVEAWDPFLLEHYATYSSPIERVGGDRGGCEIQGHVLPHKDRLSGDEHRSAGGPDGWTAQQGFYVYRNERLLVAGHWLGLGQGRSWTKEQAHQLARIRVDITNTADVDWKIDVRKSVARPPVHIRHRLVRIAEDIRERARRVFAHRAQAVRVGSEPVVEAWRAEHFGGVVRYRINQEHPAVTAVLDQAGERRPELDAMLRILEETVPVQRIWLDASESPESPRAAFAGEANEQVRTVLALLYRNLVRRKGMSPHDAREQLLRTEPFHACAELVAALPEDIE